MAAKWTQEDINRLKQAISSGVLSVRFEGPPARTVTYHSLAEMRSLLAEMEREVSGSPGYAYLQTSKGF